MDTCIGQRLPNSTDLDGDDDLYQKYCRFMDAARHQLMIEFPPSPQRDETMRRWATEPREHFEARLVTLRRTPQRLERLLYLLRRGFIA